MNITQKKVTLSGDIGKLSHMTLSLWKQEIVCSSAANGGSIVLPLSSEKWPAGALKAFPHFLSSANGMLVTQRKWHDGITVLANDSIS